MVDTLSSLSATAKQYHDADLLYRAQDAQVFYDAGRKKNLPKRKGNSIGWRRFNALAVATSALTEGTPPAATSLSMTEVTATPAQYGAFCQVSDRLDLMGIDPVISEAIEVFGQQAGESIETLIADVLKAGTSVYYGGAQTARANLTASHVLTVDLLRKAATGLDVNKAKRFNGPEQNKKPGQGDYLLFLHPLAVADLKRDTEWKTHVQNTPAYEKLYSGEIGMIEGCRIIQSTLCPIFTGAGSAGANVYACILVGENAFGIVDVAGLGKFNTEVKQIGSAGAADPLSQYGTVGWKAENVSKILNNNFMTRIEVGATNG